MNVGAPIGGGDLETWKRPSSEFAVNLVADACIPIGWQGEPFDDSLRFQNIGSAET